MGLFTNAVRLCLRVSQQGFRRLSCLFCQLFFVVRGYGRNFFLSVRWVSDLGRPHYPLFVVDEVGCVIDFFVKRIISHILFCVGRLLLFLTYNECNHNVDGPVGPNERATLPSVAARAPRDFRRCVLSRLFHVFKAASCLCGRRVGQATMAVRGYEGAFYVSVRCPYCVLYFIILCRSVQLSTSGSRELRPGGVFFFMAFPRPTTSGDTGGRVVRLGACSRSKFCCDPFGYERRCFECLRVIQALYIRAQARRTC